jgi:hypothetical protein
LTIERALTSEAERREPYVEGSEEPGPSGSQTDDQ